jgi:hypothetical protein
MKKLYTEHKFKRYNKRRALKSLRRRLVFTYKHTARNKSFLGKSWADIRVEKEVEQGGYEKVTAPKNFTFIGNTEKVIRFISRLREHFDKKRKVFVVLNGVKSISYDSIIVLLSIMVRFKSHNIKFNGDFPRDETANKILTESGFFENLFKNFREKDTYNLNKEDGNSIHTHAAKAVDSILSAKVIGQATKTVWNEKRRCQGIQRTMIELMLNTNNHATIDKEGERHWWLSANHIKEENRVCFSFVDYGVGIFKSLNNKPSNSKFYKAMEKLKSLVGLSNNAGLLESILKGKLHETVTGFYFRGKGLPGIYEALGRNSFSNLYIISNNVFADVVNGNYVDLNNNFEGTFIYWELNQTNISCNG